MTVVIDTSGAVEIALEKTKGKIFLDILKSADVVIAPDLFVSEVTNVFWKYRNFSGFSDAICLKGIEFCVNLVDDYLASIDLWREAYFEGVKNQSSVYDMFYLIAARRNSAMLVSMDQRLNSIADAANIKIVQEAIYTERQKS